MCKKLNINYPKDIHSTDLKYGKDLRIKENLKNELIKYMADNGNYHFIYIIKGNHKRGLYTKLSNIIDDDNASNLYDNMLANLVQNTLFYNPYLEEKDYSLKIASRIAYIDKNDKKRIREYEEKLGYHYSLSKKEKGYIFYLNNNVNIKSIIPSKMIENRIKKNINIHELNVKTINYEKSERQKSEPNTPFLYVADLACDIIKTTIVEVSDKNNHYLNTKEKILNMKRQDFYIEESQKKLSSLCKNKIFIWAYDDIEELWNELNLSVYKKDFLSSINNLYSIQNSDSPFRNYYNKFWCPALDENINSLFDEKELDLYLGKLETYIFVKDKAEYERGLFIGKVIYKLLRKSKFKNKEKYLFRLNVVLLRGYNHRGDTLKGHRCLEECEKRKDSVSALEYIEFVNRKLEVYVNEFNFEKCIEKGEYIKESLDIYKDFEGELGELLDKKPGANILRGKVLSSLGQFYSFNKEKDKAIEYFKEALEELKESKRDVNTTLSYILHLAVDTKDFELYGRYSRELWGEHELEAIFY